MGHMQQTTFKLPSCDRIALVRKLSSLGAFTRFDSDSTVTVCGDVNAMPMVSAFMAKPTFTEEASVVPLRQTMPVVEEAPPAPPVEETEEQVDEEAHVE